MAESGKEVIRFLDLLYETASDSGSWNPALEAFANLTGGVAAGLYLYQHSNACVPFLEFWRKSGLVRQEGLDEYARKWMQLDPRMRWLRERKLPVLFHDDLMITREEKARTPFFRDFEHKFTPIRYAVGSRILFDEDSDMLLTVLLPTVDKRRIQKAVQLYQLLGSHLSRAAQMHQLLGVQKVKQETERAVLDKLGFGVLFLDQQGAVCFSNTKSREMLQRKDGVALVDNSIILTDHCAEKHMKKLIGQCLETQHDGASTQGGWMQAARAEKAEDYAILVSRLPPVHRSAVLSQPTVLIFISEPQVKEAELNAALVELYRLTPTELHVCARLAAGLSVAEMAVKMSVSQDAIRYHLKNIFSKTGVHSQAGLVKLALSMPGNYAS